VGQADLSLGDGTLTPAPGLAAILTHGMDFFDRPSGVVIPQFASSLAASLGGPSSDGAQDSQARGADQETAESSPTTTSRDYDQFSDRVGSMAPTRSAYDGFSDVVGSDRVAVGNNNTLTNSSSNSQPAQTQDSGSSATLPSLQASDDVSGPAGSNTASSTRVTQGRGWRLFPPPPADWHPPQPGAEALAAAEDIARADPLYFDPTQNLNPADVGRSLANSMTFGKADQLAAYLAAKTGISGVYGDYDGNLQAQQYLTEHADPKSAELGELGSFALGAGAVSKLASTGLKLAGITRMAAVGADAAAVKGGAAAAGKIGAIIGEDAATGAAATAESTGATGALAGSAEAGTAAASAEANAAATSVESGATAAEGETASNTARTLADEASAGSESSSAAEGVAADDADANPGWRELNRAQKKVIRDKLKTMFNNSKEVVYEFSSAGLKYVGQTSRGYARMIEHLRTGKLHPKDLDSISFQQETRGKFAREVAETKRIKELGGLESTANINWPVSSARLPVPSITP